MKRLVLRLSFAAALAALALPARASLFGSGTKDDPYFVSSVANWTEFAHNIAAGIGTNACYKLGTHVLGATNCVGTAEHPFAGTFDGNGFTLRVELEDTENQGTAPFRHVECATITNLTVTGTVVGTTHAAGLVGFAHGAWLVDGRVWLSRATTVADCTVGAFVSNPATSGDRHLGGVVGHALSSRVVIRDTVFDGAMQSSGNCAGGFVGWADDGVYVEIYDSIFAGSCSGGVTFDPVLAMNQNVGLSEKGWGVYSVQASSFPDAVHSMNGGWAPMRDIATAALAAPPEDGFARIVSKRGTSVFLPVDSSIDGLASEYVDYDGAALLDYTVSIDGAPAQKGADYAAVLTRDGAPVAAADASGDYVLTLSGLASAGWAGSISRSFRVVRASLATDAAGRYLVRDASDWDALAGDVAAGLSYEGRTVLLAADVSGATNCVGTAGHPFAGTFDGGGRTLAVAIEDTAGQGTAPFRYLSGATVSNLTVAGTVVGTTHAAGLVGFSTGTKTNLVADCTVAVAVSVPATDGNRHMGGVVGHALSSSLAIRGTVFSGSMSNSGSYAGGLVGWCDGGAALDLSDCLFKGTHAGDGAFHPVAVRDSGAAVDARAVRIYYAAEPTLADAKHVAADGARVFAEPDPAVLGREVEAADGLRYWARARFAGARFYRYTGEAIEPDIALECGGEPLVEGWDYVVSLSPAVLLEVGEYTATVAGTGDCAGSEDFALVVSDAEPVTASTTTLSGDGTRYLVYEDVEIDARITVTGRVTLVLGKDATLRANKGIGVNEGNALVVTGEGSLFATAVDFNNTVYVAAIGGDGNCNSGDIVIDGGSVVAENPHPFGAAIGGGDKGNGHVTINGGTVVATTDGKGGSNFAAAIGGGFRGNGTVTINGGTVVATATAWSAFDIDAAAIGGGEEGNGAVTINGGTVVATANGEYAAAIGGGDGYRKAGGSSVTINGGRVTASGGRYAPSIGSGKDADPGTISLGWTDESDFIDADSISDGTVTFARPFRYLEGGEVRGFATVDNLADKEASWILSPWEGPKLHGLGTEADPLRIATDADWETLASDVAAGARTEGLWFRQTANVRAASPVGLGADKSFRGVYDGGGFTLTAALSGTSAYVAPFSAISGATIRDLVVAGTVSGGMHCTGLVGLVAGGTNTIEDCEIAAAISTGRSHFGGIVGHGASADTTLRGCVFSGSLSGGTYVATLNAWSDEGATTRVVDCLDASAGDQPIGRGYGAAFVTNACYAAAKNFSVVERLWSAGNRGKRAYAVTGGAGVTIDYGSPAAAYPATGLAAYADGLARDGSFYAEAGASIEFRPAFTGTPPAGMKHDGFQTSAGTLTKNGDAWELAMPAGNAVVSATFADLAGYDLWAWQNGVSGAWDEPDAFGVHNVFRYAFDKPAGAFDDPPLLGISFDADGRPVVTTPPLVNTEGYEFFLRVSEDAAGASNAVDLALVPSGTNVVDGPVAPARFFRLKASE